MTDKLSIVARADEEWNAKRADAFANLEPRLCDLSCMAKLTFDAVFALNEGPPSDDDINLALFSMRRLKEMIDAAKADWYRDAEA